jgi:Ni/Co efflux regulator RcnB
LILRESIFFIGRHSHKAQDDLRKVNRAFLNLMEYGMKSKTAVSVILAMTMTLSSGGFAFAQGSGERDYRWRQEQMRRGDQQNHRQDWRRGNNNAQQDERGAGPNHDFRRGDRLPVEYRNRQYVVDDWRGHHLSAPPRGYHWVQTGGDYVLVAIATGVILQFLLNN